MTSRIRQKFQHFEFRLWHTGGISGLYRVSAHGIQGTNGKVFLIIEETSIERQTANVLLTLLRVSIEGLYEQRNVRMHGFRGLENFLYMSFWVSGVSQLFFP